MKVTLIDTSNTDGKILIGKDGMLSVGLTASFSFNSDDMPFELRHGYWTTSWIEKMEITKPSLGCSDILITTRNSTYLFRHGKLTDKPMPSREEIDAVLFSTLF